MRGIGKSLKWSLAIVLVLAAAPLRAATNDVNVLVWNHTSDRVAADVRGFALWPLLERIAKETGWNIFVEPGSKHEASAKFKDAPSGQALRLLLGDLNFALVPQTNGPNHLYVFRTGVGSATQQVRPAGGATAKTGRRVPNELIVRVRPGTDIEALARLLGAKIVGRIPELNAYRFQFENDEVTENARKLLAGNPDVASVQDNYFVDVPQFPETVAGMVAPETKLKLDPPEAGACQVVIGLVDTALQTLSPPLEAFVKERVSVVGDSKLDPSEPTHATATFNAAYQAMQSAGITTTRVQTISVNVFDGSSANTFNVAAGMITAGNRGATVINASLGGYGDSPLLRDAVKQLASHNIPVFAAVGNDGSSSAFYPAAYPEVISVTAVERGKVAPYANLGTQPDAAAPGSVLFSYNGVTYGSRGTSVSSAAVAGIAAGLAGANCQPWSQVIPTVEKNLPVPTAK